MCSVKQHFPTARRTGCGYSCLLIVQRPSNMLVYLRDISAQTCCHTETEVADQTFYITQSQYADTRGWYHGGQRPSSDDSLHSPTVIPPLALAKPSIMKHYHRRRTCSHTSPHHLPTTITLHNTWTVKTVVT